MDLVHFPSLRVCTCVGLAAFLVYASTAAPSIVTFFDDTLEFQYVVPTLGIAHPTGYPLYTLLGWIWSRLIIPFGNWSWRLNLFSALVGGITVGFLFCLAYYLVIPLKAGTAARLKRQIAAVAAASAFGLSPVWWQQTTVAEVYALHIFFVVAILLAAIKVRVTPSSLKISVLPLLLLVGLSLSHHRMTVLLIPGLTVYLIWVAPHVFLPHKRWITWATALIAPLLLYLYIPIRFMQGARDLHGSYENTVQGFIAHVAASSYTDFFGWNEEAWEVLSRQFGWWGTGWAVTSLILIILFSLRVHLWRFSGNQTPASSRLPEWTLVSLWLVSHLLFGLSYRVEDIAVFLLPVFLIFALSMSAGLTLIDGLVGMDSYLALSAYSIVAFFIGLCPLLYNGIVDRSHDWQAHDLAIAMAKVDFPRHSRVIGLEGEVTALMYMQVAEGLGLNAVGQWAAQEKERASLVAQGLSDDATVYLTRELPGIESKYSFSGEGPLVRVWHRGEVELPAPERNLQIGLINEQLWLDGIDLTIAREASGRRIRLAFFWRPIAQLEHRLKLSIRLFDRGTGQLLTWPDGRAVVADRFPLHQVTYSEHWLPGEQIRDVHYLSLPDDAKRPLDILVILYEATTAEELARVTIPF